MFADSSLPHPHTSPAIIHTVASTGAPSHLIPVLFVCVVLLILGAMALAIWREMELMMIDLPTIKPPLLWRGRHLAHGLISPEPTRWGEAWNCSACMSLYAVVQIPNQVISSTCLRCGTRSPSFDIDGTPVGTVIRCGGCDAKLMKFARQYDVTREVQ